jgi:hypothetical protein
MDIEEGLAAVEECFRTPVVATTKDEFLEMRNALPPQEWCNRGTYESFKMLERTYGRITQIYARRGTEYFTFADRDDLPHDAICKRLDLEAVGAGKTRQ